MHAFFAGIVRADSQSSYTGRRPDLKSPGGRTRQHRGRTRPAVKQKNAGWTAA